MRKFHDKKNSFYEMWNPTNGFYFRTGVIDEGGFDTDKDPFQRCFPALIDIGIMGNCANGLDGICLASGTQCYQNGPNVEKPNMDVTLFEKIIKQCNDKVYQVALGGRGDVNKHKDFEQILKICTDNGIVPNYTTSGYELTWQQVEITKKYCGAVAVSWYRNEHTHRALNMLISEGITTNIHYVLGNSTIDEAIELLSTTELEDRGVNAIVFLLHKPVGLGSQDDVLDIKDEKVQQFFSIVDNFKGNLQIGFDSCSVPGILNTCSKIDIASVDTCEAGRFSAYIDAQGFMYPCSFDNQLGRWKEDLNHLTIQEVWDGEKFENFRNHFRNSCSGCTIKAECLGGCPIVREIVLCEKQEKNLYQEV